MKDGLGFGGDISFRVFLVMLFVLRCLLFLIVNVQYDYTEV